MHRFLTTIIRFLIILELSSSCPSHDNSTYLNVHSWLRMLHNPQIAVSITMIPMSVTYGNRLMPHDLNLGDGICHICLDVMISSDCITLLTARSTWYLLAQKIEGGRLPYNGAHNAMSSYKNKPVVNIFVSNSLFNVLCYSLFSLFIKSNLWLTENEF